MDLLKYFVIASIVLAAGYVDESLGVFASAHSPPRKWLAPHPEKARVTG